MTKEISKTYDPKNIEDKWYSYWLTNNYFHSEPDEREPYTIVIPPPNVTGVLHMGHMLNNTIQDVLTRRARMQGKNACWVPGTDHASIATEAKVVQMLRERGIKKSDLSREDFLKYAWEWKEKYGGIILDQLKKLGASCDWERTRFTMEPKLSEAVINVFIDLYEKGLIYRELRMVNWDPQGKTALSDEEVIHKDVNSKLYYIKYKLTVDSCQLLEKELSTNNPQPTTITIATTRPETILADTAICVNPKDERFIHLIGKKVLVPFINREIEIIADEYVAMDFGTGCLKVTPAHDKNDYELGKKYNLEVIDILTEEGFLNEKAQDERYIGKDRFAVRKQITIDLEEAGHIEKVEEYKNQIGTSERTGAVIEPRLTLQWWIDMKKFIAKNPQVLDAVMNDEIKFHPANMKNTYKHWIDNIKDWCISRQLWWGQQIPAWYDEQGNLVAVAKTAEEAIKKVDSSQLTVDGKTVNREQLTVNNIHQDEDVLDTWFSSWLWPISVFDGFGNDKKDIKYYYPTNDLVTAPEIMFFWVARMIMAGYEWMGEKPFSNVYYTGIVRDKQRRKMSKSLGNSPDPLDLIAQYGADGVRMGMLICSPAGNDILFDESQVEQGRNFSNKIWNAYRLINEMEAKAFTDDSVEYSNTLPEIFDLNNSAREWFKIKLSNAITEINSALDEYRLSEALMKIYKLIWDDFCSEYLEMIKPFYGESIHERTLKDAKEYFKTLLELLHPFMPFITEEIWQNMGFKITNEKGTIMFSNYPSGNVSSIGNYDFEARIDTVIKAISQIRNLRQSKGIPFKEELRVAILPDSTLPDSQSRMPYENFKMYFKKRANAKIEFTKNRVEGAYNILVDTDEIYVFLNIEIDVDAEKSKIKSEIEYLEGFLKSVEAKLSNEKFIVNAKPEMVEKEKQKKADALAKIDALKNNLTSL